MLEIELVGVLHLELTDEVAGLMTVLPALLPLERLQIMILCTAICNYAWNQELIIIKCYTMS